MKSHQGIRFAIMGGCVVLLIGCGRTEPAPQSTASAASSAPAAAPAGENVAPADWPTYNRTLAGDRFSPVTGWRSPIRSG